MKVEKQKQDREYDRGVQLQREEQRRGKTYGASRAARLWQT